MDLWESPGLEGLGSAQSLWQVGWDTAPEPAAGGCQEVVRKLQTAWAGREARCAVSCAVACAPALDAARVARWAEPAAGGNSAVVRGQAVGGASLALAAVGTTLDPSAEMGLVELGCGTRG